MPTVPRAERSWADGGALVVQGGPEARTVEPIQSSTTDPESADLAPLEACERLSPPRPHRTLVWILAPITLAVVGVALAAGGPMAQAMSHPLILSAGLCPLAHATLAWSLGGWLLRPFTVRDLTSRSLPSRRRRALRLLAATLVLPLGGLAVPWWIFLRSRWMSASARCRQ